MPDLYIDPLILPVNVAQDFFVEACEVLRQIKTISDPPPKTTCGLSNISQTGTKIDREILNRIALVLLMGAGMDSAIADGNDIELLDAAATARVLLNKEIYSDSYAKLYKSPRYKIY
jgi:5-methyltetrahydrofolate corrinoid/iron sulfur protein methyltransferase